jgi:Na+/H+ antiporter NhaC
MKGLMTIPAKVGRWVSKARWRLYFLFLLLMIVPIAFFTYSAGQVLRHQAETQTVTESSGGDRGSRTRRRGQADRNSHGSARARYHEPGAGGNQA